MCVYIDCFVANKEDNDKFAGRFFFFFPPEKRE